MNSRPNDTSPDIASGGPADLPISRRARIGRILALGSGVVALYVLATVVTFGTTHHRFLPLFDTGGAPPPYEWVKPPPQFAAGNVVPKSLVTDVPFSAGRSAATVASGTDGQFLVNIQPAAVILQAGETKAAVTVTPLDPATLAPLPTGLAPDGNAYRAELIAQPSRRSIPTLALPGDAVINVPQPASSLFFSVDGRTWQQLKVQAVAGPLSVGSPFTQLGYFVVGTSASATPVATGGGKRTHTGTVAVAVAVALALLIAAGVPLLLRSRRRDPKSRAKGRRRSVGRAPPSGPPKPRR